MNINILLSGTEVEMRPTAFYPTVITFFSRLP